MNCKICHSPVTDFQRTIVLGKYKTSYFRCVNCGFIFPANPTWLDEAYGEAITKTDIGLVGRNIAYSSITESLIHCFYGAKFHFVDYGGGYGMFVRLMRDKGFNFYRQDIYCDNLFAKGFDVSEIQDQEECGLVTAFEVFEHLLNPLEEVEKILQFSKHIFFSTTLLPEPPPLLDEWEYYGLEHGQHVALYTTKSLQLIAKRFNLYLASNGSTLHLLSDHYISPIWFKWVTRLKISRFLNPIFRVFKKPEGLLNSDYALLKSRISDETFSK